MRDFITHQLSVSTAEEEKNYFFVDQPTSIHPDPNVFLPAGLYRVIDGRLYRIIDGLPLNVQPRHVRPEGS